MRPAAGAQLLGKMVLGRYRILRHLADGGMGSIFLARNEGAAGFVRPVVVKVLLPQLLTDRRMVDLFMREARIMSTLRHPSIVSVLDFAQDGDMHVMVLDYIHGFHLGRWARYIAKTRGPFPPEVAVHVMLQVIRALGYAHSLKGPDGSPLNLVHRDVTPSNILIDVEGHTKLADFGIARMNTDKTEVGKPQIKGKMPYLAPEVLEGIEPAAISDVYSAGVTLHELLIGRNEFRAPNMAAVIARVLNHVPTRVSDLRDDVSVQLADVIAKAMARKPDDRYRSAAEFADALAGARTWTEDEGARRVAEMAGEDFRDPRMAEVLAVPALENLESSWNTPTPMSLSQVHAAIRPAPNDATEADGDEAFEDSDDDPLADLRVYDQPSVHDQKTMSLSPRTAAAAAASMIATTPPRSIVPGADATPASAPPRKLPWGPIVMGAGLVVVGAIGVIALLQSQQRDEPDPGAYVVVDQRAQADAGAAALVPDGGETIIAIPPDAAPDQPGAIDAGPRKPPKIDAGAGAVKPPDTAQDLTRAFEKQRGKVQACFESNAADLEGTTDLAVRFRVDTDGSVAEAEMIPSSLSGTALGTCLLGIARATKFPTLDKPTTFRVPLKARVK